MSESELRSELERLRPFHHRIELPYGLSTFAPELSRRPVEGIRVDSFVRHAFPALLDLYGGSLAGKRVLDVACNCGGFSFEAARAGADRVLGFDVADRYIEQANPIRRALGVDQPEFRVMSIDDVTPEKTGSFDVVLCLGILYHLEDPVGAMRSLLRWPSTRCSWTPTSRTTASCEDVRTGGPMCHRWEVKPVRPARGAPSSACFSSHPRPQLWSSCWGFSASPAYRGFQTTRRPSISDTRRGAERHSWAYGPEPAGKPNNRLAGSGKVAGWSTAVRGGVAQGLQRPLKTP